MVDTAGARRDLLLVAAVDVLGTVGARGLTHRAVDRVAGVPEGTTSNYFRTRRALVAAVLGHITRHEAAPLAAVALDRLTADDVVRVIVDRLEFLLGPGRRLAVARHALFLEAAVDPTLQPELVAASRYWWQLGQQVLSALGTPEPARRSRWLFAYLDGLVIDQLARPDPDFDITAAVRAGLDGLRQCT